MDFQRKVDFMLKAPVYADGTLPSAQEISWWIFWAFLNADKDKDKEKSAHMILRMKPIYRNEYLHLFDTDEICKFGMRLEKRIIKSRKSGQRRRHQKREDFSLTDEQWEETMEWFDYRCSYCGSTEKMTYDHFIPFSKGGSFHADNIIPACGSCNSSKRDHEALLWFRSQPFYSVEREERILDHLKSMSLSLTFT